MPRTLTHLTALLASPTDLAAERDIVEEAIQELNQQLHDDGIHLDLWRWEKSAIPAAGTDPQAVLNEQAGDDYDIFIGLLWHRFGSPTPRASSGTEEEFDAALARARKAPEAIAIMFYLKDSPPAKLSELDPSEYEKVIRFRGRLGEEGVLFQTFSDPDELSKLLRTHLRKVARDLFANREKSRQPIEMGDGSAAASEPSAAEKAIANQDEAAEEEGFIDLMERAEEASEILTQVMGRLSGGLNSLTARLHERSEEIEAFKDRPPNAARVNPKSMINKAAMDLEQFAVSTEAEIPLYSEQQSIALEAWIKASSLQKDFSEEQATATRASLLSLHENMQRTRAQIGSFRESVAQQPRLTTHLNRARRRAVKAIDGLIAEIDKGIKILKEAEKSFD